VHRPYRSPGTPAETTSTFHRGAPSFRAGTIRRVHDVGEEAATEAQAAALRALGCEQAQGFLYGRPVRATPIASRSCRPGG